MRYLLQLLVPALIVIGVIFVLLRNHSGRSEAARTSSRSGENSDKGMIIAIIIIGAAVAIAVVMAMQGVWNHGS